jgi:glycosyltransferase involved in cell wall biosynthesis
MDISSLGFSGAGGSVKRIGDPRRVTLVVSGFPTPEDPHRGIFNVRAAQALSPFVDVTVVFLRAWAPGRARWQLANRGDVRVLTVTAPQIPGKGVFGGPLGVAASILLYRVLGWYPVRETIMASDLVHSVDAVVGMIASAWASRARKPHVAQVIGSDINIIAPRLPSVVAKGWEKSVQGIICNSKELERRFSALYPGVPNIRTIPRGVDPGVFNPAGPPLGPQAQQRPVRFAFFGGFRRQAFSPYYIKGGPTLLTAWQEHEEDLARNGASLLLAGRESCSEVVTRWHRALRYPDHVYPVGGILPAEMPAYLRAADAVLVPSLQEGLPNLCMEASASGRAVLGSAVGGIPEIIVHGQNGLILNPSDVQEWGRALVLCSRESDRLREMGQRGRARALELFDSRDYGSKILKLYAEALRERVPATRRRITW